MSLVRTSLDQFNESFKKEDFSKLPFQIETNNIYFEINRTDSGKGYPGIVNTEVIKVPEETLKDNLKYWLI
ncbi:hypothetical protein METP3_03473 [Methanosarcinales archaeon]|nr:hypothetical protein METP3_03473 [Methanosarcinales archaeon]